MAQCYDGSVSGLAESVERAPEVPKLTKKRYLELISIADQVCVFLKEKGIEQYEGCRISELANRFWQFDE